MAELRTEEEQIEAIKSWWQENGKSLVLGIALAVAAVLGWKAWQQKQAADAENASVLYQNLVEAVVTAVGPQGDAEKATAAQHLAAQIKSDYSGRTYAAYAALLMAKVAVEQQDYTTAIAELDWVQANFTGSQLTAVAALRKAELLAAQGDVEAALSLLNSTDAQGYVATMQELKGDLLLRKGDRAAAEAAYKVAAEQGKDAGVSPILQMKLDDLATEGQ